MKTTIDIPDPLYRQVKIRAFERGASLREMMINSLRREIEADQAPASTPLLAREEKAIYTTDNLGFVVLKRGGRKQVVKDAFIDELRNEEGVFASFDRGVRTDWIEKGSRAFERIAP
ncbi:MAG TPA: hypothetical protein PKE12_15415 [Kiritimatiellia bacterium]|nr:hypothetical protein [Kiritimatiellia bacterium]